jgi:uncharacterized protein
VPDDDQPISCPHCHSEMHQLVHDGVEVSVCRACGGIWLDSHEVNRLLCLDPKLGRPLEDCAPFTQPNLTSTLACPRCEGAPPLLEVGFVEVEEVDLDLCKTCHGLFVDHDEALAIIRFLKWLDGEEPQRELTARPVLELLRSIADCYGPGTGDRPSWDDAVLDDD